ncbi:MAG: hypothetical protein ACKESB_03535 [Candidatus Hodgkinia cicadicola]
MGYGVWCGVWAGCAGCVGVWECGGVCVFPTPTWTTSNVGFVLIKCTLLTY